MKKNNMNYKDFNKEEEKKVYTHENVVNDPENHKNTIGDYSSNDSTGGDNQWVSKDEYLSLLEQLESYKKKSEEYLDIAKRGQADFENYKKRMSNSISKALNDGAYDIVKNILPVIDNLERAINTDCENDNTKAIIVGVEHVLKQFVDILKSEGVEEIEALGQCFNPELHNAIMVVEKQAAEDEDKVVEVIQKGYRIKDRVIRHSVVKVAK